jgi:hypothetical protein
MKKIAIVGLLSLCAAGVYAQGTLIFYNNFSDLDFQIYQPNPSSPAVQQVGDTSDQGTISGVSGPYTTYGGIAIGGALDPSPSTSLTPASYTYGNDFTAQIFAMSAGNATVSGGLPIPAFTALSPVTQYIEQFATTSGGGANLNSVAIPGDPGIPGTGYSGSGHGANSLLNNAFIAVAAWYNAGGTINSLSAAQTANVPWGTSDVALLQGLGEPASVMTSDVGHITPLTVPTEPYGITSFSLISVPEPSTIALGLMGVCGFLARRRKA